MVSWIRNISWRTCLNTSRLKASSTSSASNGQEVSALQSELQSLKDALAAERILLSPDKLAQREKAIQDKEAEVIALQQKYFGPEGELFTKRAQLVQPIQDKVFGAVQALATKRKLDLILDKSADSGVLFVEKEKDYSDEVLNSLKR